MGDTFSTLKNNPYPTLTERNAADRCAGTSSHIHTNMHKLIMHPAKLLRDVDKKPARAGHPSIIKQAGDKGRDMETWVGGWEVLMKWGDKGFRGYEYFFFKKWLAESCPIFSTASGSQRITHSTVNWVTANVNYELCFLHIRAFYRRPWGRWRKKSSRLTS